MKQFTDFLQLLNKIMVPVGNYGIPRSMMPQIDSDLVPDFMEFLEDREVELEFAAVVGGDDVAAGPQAGLRGVVRRFRVDQFVQPRDVFLRRYPPDARG